MSGIVFDAGALIAFEKGAREAIAFVDQAAHRKEPVLVPAGALAQVWRDGRRQARLARLLASPVVQVVPLDAREAQASGQLCGIARTADVIDASVVACARAHSCVVVTSDAKDLLRLDPRLDVIEI